VDCLAQHQEEVRSVLGSEASFTGVGYGYDSSSGVELLDSAAVVILRSLLELSGAVACKLSKVQAVVLTAPAPSWPAEEELAAELRVRRLLRAQPATCLAEERADTELALLLSLVRRTAYVSAELQHGAWLPPHAAYAHSRRCSALTCALVGLDESTAGVAKRCAAFGCTVLFCHPLPGASCEDDDALVAAAYAAGAVPVPTLAELLTRADAVCLHSPPSAGVVLGAAELQLLHPGAMLVCTGPSAGLCTASLKKALLAGALAGAALDAPEAEAFLEATAREQRGLILTMRCAAHSEEAAAARCVSQYFRICLSLNYVHDFLCAAQLLLRAWRLRFSGPSQLRTFMLPRDQGAICSNRGFLRLRYVDACIRDVSATGCDGCATTPTCALL
jgi:phosphoglycerate dehydrogenase-like enzyme